MNNMEEFGGVGCHFGPWETEIIEWLKAEESQVPQLVVRKQLYGENSTPWDILTDEDPCWISEGEDDNCNSKKHSIYVYTKLTYLTDIKSTTTTGDGAGARGGGSSKGNNKNNKNKKTKKGTNVSRKAGRGSWSGQNKPTEITRPDGTVIGEKKLLTYEVRGGGDGDEQHAMEEQHGRWNMHEYNLAGIYEKSDFVICKITKDEPLFLRKKKRKSSSSSSPCKEEYQATKKTTTRTMTINGHESIQNAGSVAINSDVLPAATTTQKEIVDLDSFWKHSSDSYSQPGVDLWMDNPPEFYDASTLLPPDFFEGLTFDNETRANTEDEEQQHEEQQHAVDIDQTELQERVQECLNVDDSVDQEAIDPLARGGLCEGLSSLPDKWFSENLRFFKETQPLLFQM